MPVYRSFSPDDITADESVRMTVDEYEAVRLLDAEGLTQEACADRISQNPNMRKLYCYDNSIKELDLSECPALIEKRKDDYYLNVDENVQLIYSAGISIDASVFPDEIFRSYISETFDTDSNGLLSPKEIRAVISIDINEKDIQSLDGIQTFTALQTLNCEYNLLTELDVSENPVLTELDCAENQLLSLDVSHNPALTALYCSDNPLKALDLSHNTELMILGCSNDQLTSLDVSPLEALTELYCDNNQLTQLDVSHNPALNTLRCENNQLTVLDVSHNPELVIFSCGTNALTTLDVSQNALLRHMSCESNLLTALDVSNHPALKELFCQRNRLRLLNVSGDTALSWLFCGQNQLTALNLSDSPALTQLNCDGNRLEIPRGRFDLSELPNLDLARTSNWTGGLIEDGTLISDPFAKRVSYTYDCDGKHRVSFILMLAEEPAPMLLPTGLRRIESEAFINVDARAFILPASIEFIAGDAFPEDAAIYYPIGTDTEAWCLAHSEELPGCLPFQPDA